MILQGDCLNVLSTLDAESIQTCVTSPPYFGLRDYDIEGQVGLEESPKEYVDKIVSIFREIKRVLRDDGTVWLNLGDSYATTHHGKQGSHGAKFNPTGQAYVDAVTGTRREKKIPEGLKSKDLIGIPWRVAFALQDDGWYLRSDIIFAKGSCMPESVKDRPTRSHEYIFLLSKSAKYYYDHESIKEPLAVSNAQRKTKKYNTKERYGAKNGGNSGLDGLAAKMRDGNHTKKNKRSVWNVNPKPYKGAHFAVFPPELIRPCVLAGAPKGGTVLDPFCGSGTVGAVCKEEGREFLGIELNPNYIELAEERISASTKKLF